METVPTETAPTETLRERKKRRTRDALLRAALELFTTQGYERTTVDEIADAVVFMASDLARGITGHCLDVNCGEYHH